MKAEKVLGSYTEQILDQNFLELSRFGDDVVKFAESVYGVLEKQQHLSLSVVPGSGGRANIRRPGSA